MNTTPILDLPYIMGAQAQKHITHNEALRKLDALVQIHILTEGLLSPPNEPNIGERYIVGVNAVEGWAGHDFDIALWEGTGWSFYAPQIGWMCWVADISELRVWNGTGWASPLPANASGTNGSNTGELTPRLGINATADDINRLTLSSTASLFNHDGQGHQIKLNKQAAAETASLVFQSDFSGCAELGLTGDNNLHIKVSADGVQWVEALTFAHQSGNISLQTNSASHCLTIGGDRTLAFAGGNATLKTQGHRLTLNDGGVINLMSDNVRLNGFDAGAMMNIQAGHSLKTPLVIRAAAGQVADLLRVQSESGASVFELDKDGSVAVTDNLGAEVTSVLTLYHNSTVTTSAGSGTAIVFQSDNTGNNKQSMGQIHMEATDVVGHLSADFVVQLNQNGPDPQEVLRVTSEGKMGVGVTDPACQLDVAGAIRPGVYDKASVPSAVGLGVGAMACINDTVVGVSLVYSDGTDWRLVSDNSVLA